MSDNRGSLHRPHPAILSRRGCDEPRMEDGRLRVEDRRNHHRPCVGGGACFSVLSSRLVIFPPTQGRWGAYLLGRLDLICLILSESCRNPHARWKLLAGMNRDLRGKVVVCTRGSKIRKIDVAHLEPDGMPGAKHPVVSKISERDVTHFTWR